MMHYNPRIGIVYPTVLVHYCLVANFVIDLQLYLTLRLKDDGSATIWWLCELFSRWPNLRSQHKPPFAQGVLSGSVMRFVFVVHNDNRYFPVL